VLAGVELMTTMIKIAESIQCPQSYGHDSDLKLQYMEIDHAYMSTHTAIFVFSCPHCSTWWLVTVEMEDSGSISITQETVDKSCPIEPEYDSEDELPF
jgi:hypothetical protein